MRRKPAPPGQRIAANPIARSAFTAAPHLAARLCLSNQTAPTPWLPAAGDHQPLPGEQLTMFA